jgi:hypothetical protein
VIRPKRTINRPQSGERSNSASSSRSSNPALGDPLGRLQGTYRDTAVDHFEAFAREIGQSAALDYDQKVEVLVNAVARITNVLDELTRPAPELAPELFEHREDLNENAFQFTLRVYGKYLEKGLSKANIRSLDPKLYQGILNRERRHRDDTLTLSTKAHMNDRLLAQFTSLAEITASIPEVFRRRLRLYRTLAFRRQQQRQAGS